ncbi:DNA recombination protein RmuC [bacterium]|nr:MAG: DNA recombination protein RmuC [bacterium]
MTEFLGTLSRNHKTEANALREGLAGAIADINAILREQNATIAKGQADQTSVISKGQSEQTAAVVQTLEGFAAKVRQFEGKTEATLEKMREGVEKKLTDLQSGNEQKLEEMRATVDEKLHSTLEKRLGESFSRVSEGLARVQDGLGEMKALATGVGDLKKVLSNVKTRGNWGEVQLGNLLEQIMAPAQYSTNVPVTNGRERVEFAIKLPGRDDSQKQIWLPIDAKFPQETYARLVAAEEAGDLEARDRASKELEDVVKKCAGDICKKYISPPLTTDFAILYLPTEGLYAEVVKRTGIVEHLHRECRVVVAGPTTIAALLNSLQMGFRTLEIQKNSSKINEVLTSVKTEFGKYALVLDKIKKNLDTAQNTVDEAQRRTRAITRNLDKVEVVESGATSKNLVLSAAEPTVEVPELELSAAE